MSEPDAVPLPREGEVFFDVRGEARCLRLSWYADSAVAVFSIWQGNRCTGTFRLPFKDLARMTRTLQSGPGKPAVADRPDHGYVDRAMQPGYGSIPGYGAARTGQHYAAGQPYGSGQPNVPDHGHAAYGQVSSEPPGFGADTYGLADYNPPNYSDAPWQASERGQARYSPGPAYPSPSYPSGPSHPAEARHRAGDFPSAEPAHPAGHRQPAGPSYPPDADRQGSYSPRADPGHDTSGLRAASPAYTGHVTGWMPAPHATQHMPAADGDDLAANPSLMGYPSEPATSPTSDRRRTATYYPEP